jgi:hypothetical protein
VEQSVPVRVGVVKSVPSKTGYNSDRISMQMDVLTILVGQLRAVERLYGDAAGVFAERKRKIEAGEPPYEPPPFDPDYDDTEPPFLTEWLEAEEFQDIIGQACISIVHLCLKDYLDGVIERSGIQLQAEKYMSRRRNSVKGESWLGRYMALFAEAYGIDWTQSPVAIADLEEINLARNDIQHGRPASGLNRYQSEKSALRFPFGLFISDFERSRRAQERGHSFTEIHVSAGALKEAIQRVESFCTFIENYR